MNDDDVLGDIMTELAAKPAPTLMPPPVVNIKKKTVTPRCVAICYIIVS